tara:strand:- start:921 stop:1337 length:417 start_codon:yes stop_codon:yes gene_type:complete
MGRILGVDYGESRIGLALSDLAKIIASPYCTIPNRNPVWLKNKIQEIILEKEIESFVIGLPIGMNGQDTIQTKKVRSFAKLIEQFNIIIYFQDERLSSQSAKRSLVMQNIKTGHNKNFIDDTAAAIFLQQFLDSKSNI